MKILLVLSAVVALALADDYYKAAYIPLADEISYDPSVRIVGGRKAVRNQFPYQISLQERNGLSFSHICGGSIVSRNWIVTAAHCTVRLTAANSRVVAGILLLNDAKIAGKQIRNVQTIINHPLYPGANQVAPNDISLIRLAVSLSYRVNVKPVRIPAAGRVASGTGVLSGWGLLRTRGATPNQLQFARLRVVPEAQCNKFWTSLFGNNHAFSIPLNICSRSGLRNESACNGDSGGPYVINNRLFGVVSWVLSPCGTQNAPSVYVKTSAYTDWIITNTNGEVRP